MNRPKYSYKSAFDGKFISDSLQSQDSAGYRQVSSVFLRPGEDQRHLEQVTVHQNLKSAFLKFH